LKRKEERKKERNIKKTNKKLKLNEERKHCEKIVEVLLLY